MYRQLVRDVNIQNKNRKQSFFCNLRHTSTKKRQRIDAKLTNKSTFYVNKNCDRVVRYERLKEKETQ